MVFSRILLPMSIFAATHGASFAQDSCPTRYKNEQINIIGHSAFIGFAGQYCPNLKSNAKPLLGFIAAVWGNFPSTEFECSLWKETYEEAEGRAALQVVAYGLKEFCETSVKQYGPDGAVLKGALMFFTK